MIILIPITLLYGIFAVTGLYTIWSKKVMVRPMELPEGISIVVACKDEAHNLDRLVQSLLAQKISCQLEFIFIDDSSTDSTYEKLLQWQSNDSRIRVLRNDKQGKKSAINLGVQNAAYEYIIQTDADCEVGEFWLLSMINRMLSGKSDLVLGPVYPFEKNTLLNGVIRLEWLAMQFMTALTARLKRPGMANGASMMFKKEDYLSFYSSDFGKRFASGDDMFFLSFLQKKGKAIGFNLDKKAIVKTEMPFNLKGLFHQRVRWATKASKTTNALTYFFTLIVALANFAWIGALYSVFDDITNLPILIIALCWKLVADFVIAWNMARFYNDTRVLKYVPLMFLIYPIYLLLGLIFSFKRSYNWKGREVA